MIVSFLLDGIISKYAPYSIFTLIYLIFIKKNNFKKYYLTAFLMGFLFDYFYSNLIFYNSFIFLECAFIINFYEKKFKKNLINFSLLVILIVINYYTFSFITLSIIKYISFDLNRYLNIITNSIIVNLILAFFMYFIKYKRHKIYWWFFLKKITKLLIIILLFLITIVLFKKSASFKSWFNEKVLNNSISFTSIASIYESLFGSPIPSQFKTTPVFSEKLEYSRKEKFDGGVLLTVDKKLIPSIDDGLVINIFKKDNKNCVIIENLNVEITYCLLENYGIKLYDHVEKGSYIGEVNNKLLLYFKKDGEFLNYEDFI